MLRSLPFLLLPILACSGSSAAEDTMQVEYRRVSLSQTCLGNWKVRVDDAGNVFYARNTEPCPDGGNWSAEYPAEPQRTLGTWQLWRFRRAIPVKDLLALPEHVTDPNKAAMGGSQEQVHIVLDGNDHEVVFENVSHPAATSVRKAAARLVRGL